MMTSALPRQAFWFTIVGATAALVHFVMLVLLVNVLSLSPAWANCGAFLVAFLVSFSGHFYLTFQYSSTSISEQSDSKLPPSSASALQKLAKWFLSSVAGFLLNQGLFVLGLTWIGDRYYVIIWFVVTALVTVMTFLLGKLWAFKQ